MDKVKENLMMAWKDGACHEYDMEVIRNLLKDNKHYVNFFIDIFDKQKDKRDTAFLIILNVLPYTGAIEYAMSIEGWDKSDFEDYEWYNESNFSCVERSEVDDWINSNG